MSAAAIVMMVIGCGGLWGGCALASYTSYKHSKKEK